MTLTSNMTPAHSRQLVRVTIVPVALAAMFLTAPAAYALTEQQIQDECKAAGGTYTTVLDPSNGDRTSTCCYKDNKGKQYCDLYLNGRYLSTSPRGNEPGTPTATVHPVQPPPGTVAPVNPGTAPATVAPVIP